ncbi:MAG: DUF6475 domain-containing protein [Dokdonella sp.]|uniref:DUF6475 domain-containing protein n=1 Tax=Dokdonella sp. TaxID=2291710 RepID=UPI003F80EDC7
MRPADRREFVALLTQALGFYRQDCTEFTVDVWWQACLPFDIEQVRKALTAHALDPDRGQFAPKPADLVRQLAGTTTDRELLAWQRVQNAMRSVGAYASPDFRDPVLHQAIVDLGGWTTVCRTPVDELPFLQKRFCDLHRTLSARGAPDAPLRLVGAHEAANVPAGLAGPGTPATRLEQQRAAAIEVRRE